jgi:hypothetical protein
MRQSQPKFIEEMKKVPQITKMPHKLPAWLLRMPNQMLLAEFEATYDEYDAGNLVAIPRLDVLHAEINRRECSGQWTEDDWKPPQRPRA